MSGAIIWTDATIYSQGQRGKKEPNAWAAVINGCRVWVGSRHLYAAGKWAVTCREAGLDARGFADVSLPARDAQIMALALVEKELVAKAKTLVDQADAMRASAQLMIKGGRDGRRKVDGGGRSVARGFRDPAGRRVAGKLRAGDCYRVGGVYLLTVGDALDAADAALEAVKGGRDHG